MTPPRSSPDWSEVFEALVAESATHYVLLRALVATHPDKQGLLAAFDREMQFRRDYDSGTAVPDEAIERVQSELASLRGLIEKFAERE